MVPTMIGVEGQAKMSTDGLSNKGHAAERNCAATRQSQNPTVAVGSPCHRWYAFFSVVSKIGI